MNLAISMLGAKVTDKITGFEGVVTSIGFDLYGCIQAIVQPPSKDGKVGESAWFDIKRLTETGRAMDAPKFALELGGEPGGDAKPLLPRKPLP